MIYYPILVSKRKRPPIDNRIKSKVDSWLAELALASLIFLLGAACYVMADLFFELMN